MAAAATAAAAGAAAAEAAAAVVVMSSGSCKCHLFTAAPVEQNSSHKQRSVCMSCGFPC